MCIVETKLREQIHVNFKEEGYNSWMGDRKDKEGEGVLIMVHQYGEDKVEVMGVTIQIEELNRKIRYIMCHLREMHGELKNIKIWKER
ncbi:hypothetical protein E2C01_025791 [Portunus trituberculatus]|uniref:Uncharacterized protein n=1 Tax=Portunus trituberculatus TaxID=210409 RepID=A0A5B7EDV7_PORTR|nr:hypothetical protein [Portunus trituberculatus]